MNLKSSQEKKNHHPVCCSITYNINVNTAIQYIGHPPRFCFWKWALVYLILFILFAVFVAGVVVLYFLPSVPPNFPNGTQLYKSSTVFVPISPSVKSWTKWLTFFSFSINATACEGDIYEIPCNQLQPHLYSYDFNSGVPTFIYCLDGSNFTITWNNSKDPSENHTDIWVTSSYYDADHYRFDGPPDCHSPQADHPSSTCRRLTPENNSTVVTTNASSRYDGQYYFLVTHVHAIQSLHIHINQLYYNISDYPNPVDRGKVIGKSANSKAPLHSTFQPTNFSIADNDCFLMHVDKHNCKELPPNTPILFIHSLKRYDAMFWPGLAAGLTLVALVCLLIIQTVVYLWRRNAFYCDRELQPRH